MKGFKKVEGHSGLVKNPKTGVVLNINQNELRSARKRKKKKQEQDQELQDMRSEMSEIKSLLQQLLEK